MPEDSLEAPKNVRGALQNNKSVRGASQNNKHLWSHVKSFGLNILYLQTQFSNFLSPTTLKKLRQIQPRVYLSTTP
jgi:hypothetical protein